MSRKPIFSTSKEIAAALKGNISEMTYDHKQRLIATGHIVAKNSEEPRIGRGRKEKVYELSGKGKGLVNLSKNWK